MKEFNYREAGKYLASLRTEIEGKLAMLDIAEATVDSKKQLESVKSAIEAQKVELDRYKNLVSIAKQDAVDAEDAAVLKINMATTKALEKAKSIEAAMDIENDNLKLAREMHVSECERLNADMAEAISRSNEAIKKAQAAEQDAITKRDQAIVALKNVASLTGGDV